MAQAIDRNHGIFGGAFVVVSPDGETLEILILDPHADPATLWATLKAKCEMALMDMEQKQREAAAGFNQFRR
jgi:hypothetical protein